MAKLEYPHSYKEQRTFERRALEARKEQLANGIKLPPVCGYVYLPRKSKQFPNMERVPTPCMRNAGAGTDHLGRGLCDYHEIAAENDYAGAPKTVQQARNLAYERSMFLGLPRPVDPHTALMEEVQRSAGMVEWLRQRMAEKAEEYETAKAAHPDSEIYAGGSDALLVQWTPKNGQTPSAWWVLYQEERRHLIAACTAAIKAGVAERRVQIAEQQGQMIVALFYAFIHDTELGLAPDQIMKAPELIRKHMAALPRGEDVQHPAQQVIEAYAR